MPAPSTNPIVFDIMFNTGAIDIACHITRATPAGALAGAPGMLKGRERITVRGAHVQPCAEDGECWFERASRR